LPIFDCAFIPQGGTRSIPWQAHVKMMAAAQPFLSGAISKTVNMPRDTTPEEIARAYIDGWKLGLKALAIYRDGSKESQPVSTTTESDKAAAKEAAKPRRERLPDTRRSITHKFSIAGHEGYVNVGLYDDGRAGELFITMAKEGSTIGGLMDCFGTSISICLQYGVPLEVLVNKFSHTRFEPMGHTKNPDIRIAKSIVDYIFRWLGMEFLPGYREASLGLPPGGEDTPGGGPGRSRSAEGDEETERPPTAKKAGGRNDLQDAHKAVTVGRRAPLRRYAKGVRDGPPNGRVGASPNGSAADASASLLERAGAQMLDETRDSGHGRSEQFAGFQSDAPACDNCGSITVRNGNCYLCHNCGNSMGCS
jgi:ribonucleoside-diphosphate reductase alpha chain